MTSPPKKSGSTKSTPTKRKKAATKGGKKKEKVTLKSLNLKHKTMEVKILETGSVRKNIELLFLKTLKNIMDGQGLQYQVPSRSTGNQLYVPELDRIVLKDGVSIR